MLFYRFRLHNTGKQFPSLHLCRKIHLSKKDSYALFVRAQKSCLYSTQCGSNPLKNYSPQKEQNTIPGSSNNRVVVSISNEKWNATVFTSPHQCPLPIFLCLTMKKSYHSQKLSKEIENRERVHINMCNSDFHIYDFLNSPYFRSVFAL